MELVLRDSLRLSFVKEETVFRNDIRGVCF